MTIMQKNNILHLSLISTLSMAALLCFQVYWLYNSYQSTYNKFIDYAGEALQEACNKERGLRLPAMSEQIPNNQNNIPTITGTQIIAYGIRRTPDNQNNTRVLTPPVNIERLDSLFRLSLSARGLSADFALEVTLPDGSTETIGSRNSRTETAIGFPSANNNQVYINYQETPPASLSINTLREQTTAYMQFTPIIIFRRMAGVLIVSVLLFFVIFYCLVSQLKVIRQQKTAADMKNDFIANFTHELKTPIAVAYAALDTIERSPEHSVNAIETGKSQLKRLSDSVEKILSLSVEESARLVLNLETFSLNECISSLIAPFQLKTEKKVLFNLSFQPEQCTVYADKIHLTNALNNVIDNALKYSGEEVQIDISCEQKTNNLRIAVHDNGYGIADEDLKKIFTRFFRAKNTADKIKGFGLGLNYAKTIIELHGGAISAESEQGKGSTFIIELNNIHS